MTGEPSSVYNHLLGNEFGAASDFALNDVDNIRLNGRVSSRIISGLRFGELDIRVRLCVDLVELLVWHALAEVQFVVVDQLFECSGQALD